MERSRCGSSRNRSKTGAWKLGCSSDSATASGARPRSRRSGFLPADAEVGRPLHSSPIVVGTDTRHEMVASNYADYLFESGEGTADSFTEYFESEGITEDLPKML